MNRQFAIIAAIAVVTASFSEASPDLSWTFQWGTNTYGLLFQDTNLTATVQAVIRDDVQGVLAYNPATNAAFSTLTALDPYYGIYAGRLTLEDATIPPDFPLSLYKVIDGTNYFDVAITCSSNYMSKISLTNTQSNAVSAMSNFLATVQSMTSSNTTVQAFQQYWWHPIQNRVYIPEEVDADSITKRIDALGGLYYYCPSLLSYEVKSEGGQTWLSCEIWTRQKSDLKKYLSIDIVYGGGQWRFVPFVDD
jgi:hypothetical protein